MTMLVGTRPEARAVDYFTTPPNTLEFENVVFPRYPGFVTLPSGVQVKELCVGDGVVATASTRESLELKVRMWTVHQGRSAGETRVVFVPGDGTVIHGIEQAVLAGGGMRVGGTRRALVPPKASVSWPYVSLSEDEAASNVTKFGFAPAYDPSLGVQTPLTSGIGPVPDVSDPAARDWLDYVTRKNSFTIKPSDRCVLFDVTLVAMGSTVGDETKGGNARVASEEDKAGLGEANDRSGDGGASWWTAALPNASEYCPY